MKRSVFVLLSAVLLLSVASTAFAAGPDPLYFENDCDGWVVRGYMHLDGGDQMEVDITIDLYQGDVLVSSVNVTDIIYAADDKNFLYEGSWGMELCGDYEAVMTMWLVGIYGPGVVKRAELITDCECGPPPTCTYTPGYWKNHPDAWPVEHLTVGCEEYSKSQLLTIFGMPSKGGDMTIKLFHHLVAAKLNVLIGADDYIMSAITAGDDFLCTYGFLSDPQDDLRDDAEAIKDDLADYNEIECEEEDEEDNDVLLSIEGSSTIEKAAATEESSWGALKKRHQ
jgi:hypothetical protein